jgi:hypothetical protein
MQSAYIHRSSGKAIVVRKLKMLDIIFKISQNDQVIYSYDDLNLNKKEDKLNSYTM